MYNQLSIKIPLVLKALSHDLCLSSSDSEYLLSRAASEGVQFLTKTLPTLSKAVLTGIETGQFDYKLCTAFRRKGGLPIFLRGYLLEIFDKKGRLLDDADPVSLLQIRYLCEYFYKLALDFTPDDLKDATEKFISNEATVVRHFDPDLVKDLRKFTTNFFSDAPKVEKLLQDYRPRFGPGTFAFNDGEWGNPYYRQKASAKVFTCLPEHRSLAGYFKPYPRAGRRTKFDWSQDCRINVQKRTVRTTDSFRTSEVLFVPKDSRGPRTIVREPFGLIRGQMAFHDWSQDYLNRKTHGQINFVDQSINQQLACEGSITGCWSTLDLKDASDLVSYPLVSRVFEFVPSVSFLLKKFRSKETYVPEKGLINLNKLSGMGSGFTFPIMSYLIFASVTVAYNKRGINSRVYVYGDDVVVETRYVNIAKAAIEAIGLRLNNGKSFSSIRPAKFRESCGKDYLNGNEVRPLYFTMRNTGVQYDRPHLTLTFTDLDSALLKLERHCRELVDHQLFNLAEQYYTCLEKVLGKLPAVSGESPILGRWTPNSVSAPECDSHGNHLSIRCWLQKGTTDEFKGHDPYVHLGETLRGSGNALFTDALFGASNSLGLGMLAKPRRVVLRKRKVPTLLLR